MKCDEGSDAWNSLRISHIHVFLKNLRQHVPRKKNMEFAKVRRKIFFGEDDVFQMKEFRTTLMYTCKMYNIYIYINIFAFILCMLATNTTPKKRDTGNSWN